MEENPGLLSHGGKWVTNWKKLIKEQIELNSV